MEKKFDTNYGIVICKYTTDLDGESLYEMYDEDGGYYGELYVTDEEELTTEMIEEAISETLDTGW